MQSERWQRLQQIFEQALEMPESERPSFISRACGADHDLRKEVELLLQADSNESIVVGDDLSIDLLELDKQLEGTQLGAYLLVRRIGVGGMGSVFLAERSDGAFERQVALKIVKNGMDTESIIGRFNRERQILARLNHRNIANLLDGGVTAGGRPYFVLEFVDGLPITSYCDKHKLGVEERLELFQKVCKAVHHAHQNLVVHRDLKPSNILVTNEGKVKLLDFGIAKLLDDSDQPEMTRTGMQVLTPAYASPEQMMNLPVTTVTDVYALGVILYELLAGRRPFEVSRTAGEFRDLVLNQDPLRPSTAMQTVETHSIPSQRLRQALSGDLDTICLMALRKEPDNRYASAEQFAEDINRHLNGRPVVARRSSLSYRAGKFIRRNKTWVAMVMVFVTVIALLTSYYTLQLARERDAALAEQRKVTEIVSFVTGLFEISDPAESRGADITARELLQAGTLQVRNELVGQPGLQATMKRVLGEVYFSLSDDAMAEELAQNAYDQQLALYGAEHLDTATTMVLLGRVKQNHGDYEAADTLIRDALRVRRSQLGAEHEAVMDAISDLAFLEETRGHFPQAATLHMEALEMARKLHRGDHVVVAEMMSDLAGFYRTQNKPDLAEPMLREGIGILDRLFSGEHPLSAKMKRQLAGLLRNDNRPGEAEPLYLEAIAVQQRMLGPDHHELAVTWNSYSQMLTNEGRHEEALNANKTFIEIVERANDGPHPSLGAAYNNLAYMLIDLEQLQEARFYFDQSLAMQDAVNLPERHLNRTFPSTGIAQLLMLQGRLDESEQLYRDMLVIRLDTLDPEHQLVSELKSDLGGVLIEKGEYAEAESLLLEACQLLLEGRGPGHSRTQRAAGRLLELYTRTDRPEQAALYREVYQGDADDD